MFRLKKPEIYASEIAELLQTDLIGTDFIVRVPVSLNNICNNSFAYLSLGESIASLPFPENALIICEENSALEQECTHIRSRNPKLDFIRVINEFFVEIESFKIAQSVKIHPEAQISHNVSIGENCVIGPDTYIGENTQILNNVVIGGRVEIGKNCLIKDNATIGSEGYEFIMDEEGNPIHYPHIGKIIIRDNVWIGSNASVERAAINDTIINEYVKIDDLVQIGSGCKIEKGCMITAGSVVCMNVHIKNDAWIAPNVTIIENITVGANCKAGAGTVIINDISDNSVIVGNPAHFLRTNK